MAASQRPFGHDLEPPFQSGHLRNCHVSTSPSRAATFGRRTYSASTELNGPITNHDDIRELNEMPLTRLSHSSPIAASWRVFR
jgi:hypothetical protein